MVGGIQIRTSVSLRHPFHVNSCEKRPVLGLSGLLSVGDGKQNRKNWNATLSSLDSTIKCSKPLRQKAAIQPAGQILPDACFWKQNIYGNIAIPIHLYTNRVWLVLLYNGRLEWHGQLCSCNKRPPGLQSIKILTGPLQEKKICQLLYGIFSTAVIHNDTYFRKISLDSGC